MTQSHASPACICASNAAKVFRSPVSVSDGLLSIRRAFLPGELADAFANAGIPGVRIRRTFPYRLIAVAERPSGG